MTGVDKSSTIFSHLPRSIWGGLQFQYRVRRAERRATTGYYRDRLILVTYVEKSANTTISDCIAHLQLRLGPDSEAPPDDYGVRRQPEYIRPFDDHGLRPDIIIYRPNGGVVNRMFVPSPSNLALLHWLQTKYFIVFRHPADQVAAMYTYVPERVTHRWANNPVHTVPWNLYHEDASKDEVIAALIDDGYLLSLLKYMGDWIDKRDDGRSMILLFEDFVSDRRIFFDGVSEFLYGRKTDDAVFSEIEGVAAHVHQARKSGGSELRRYTDGPTGRAGIWRSYLSDENVVRYKDMVRRCLAAYPPARRVLELYPDLLLD